MLARELRVGSTIREGKHQYTVIEKPKPCDNNHVHVVVNGKGARAQWCYDSGFDLSYPDE